jgi:hypothetical protein
MVGEHLAAGEIEAGNRSLEYACACADLFKRNSQPLEGGREGSSFMELDNQLMDRLTVNQSDIEVGNELDKGTGEGQASIPAAEDQNLSLFAHRPAVPADGP